jgi:hypothetical protein
MPKNPVNKLPLEEVVRLLCEQVRRMTEEEKAALRYELLNGAEIPRHRRWKN